MSARKRTRPPKTVWLRPRTEPNPPASFKRGVFRYAGARDAFRKLTGQGLNEDLFWRHVWGLALLRRKKIQQSVPWYDLPGLPGHKLRRFPAQVRGWADEIQRVDNGVKSDNAYGQIAPYLPLFLAEAIPNEKYEFRVGSKMLRGVGTAKAGVAEDLARGVLEKYADVPKLAELPGLLRQYADYVEALFKITAYYGSRGAALLPRNMAQDLVRLVESCTGRPHMDEIATLLTASYRAVGVDLTVDPKALAMQRSRNRRKK